MTRRSALRSLLIGLPLLVPMGRANARQSGRKKADKVTVQVRDEFGPLKTAILHDGSNARDMTLEEVLAFAEEDGKPHPETGPVSAEKLVAELAAYRDLLAKFGVEMLAPTALEGHTAQHFTRDPCFVVGETLFLARPRDEHRENEVEGLPEECLEAPTVVDLRREGVTIEGGDVILHDEGRKVLVGTNRQTNEDGYRLLAASLKARGVEVTRIPHFRLHLDCCVAPLPDGSALYLPGSLPKSSVARLQKIFTEVIPLDRREAERYLSANILWLDRENVVSGIHAVKTNARLRSRGYKVHALDFTNVKHMWGSFRCVTCPILRA